MSQRRGSVPKAVRPSVSGGGVGSVKKIRDVAGESAIKPTGMRRKIIRGTKVGNRTDA